MLQAVEAGDDMNALDVKQMAVWSARRSKVGEMNVFSVASVASCPSAFNFFEAVSEFFAFLLRNGLSYFYGQRTETCLCALLFWPAIQDTSNSAAAEAESEESLRLDCAAQLLALGYARRELHPAAMQIVDEKLEATRRELRCRSSGSRAIAPSLRERVRVLFECFDAGPLTLQQLARIAVRRAVGGCSFARSVRCLASRLPPPILEYVEEPLKLRVKAAVSHQKNKRVHNSSSSSYTHS